MNANGGASSFGGMFDSSKSDDTTTPILQISSGNIYVNANGDGLDSNGDLIIDGGIVIIDGPTNSADGALDSGLENGGKIECNGGTVLAIGASGMAETFDNDSRQCSFIMNFNKTLQAGTQIVVYDDNGNLLFEHTSAKTFNSIVFSSPLLAIGNTYSVTLANQTETITIENISNGSSSGFAMPPGFGGQKER